MHLTRARMAARATWQALRRLFFPRPRPRPSAPSISLPPAAPFHFIEPPQAAADVHVWAGGLVPAIPAPPTEPELTLLDWTELSDSSEGYEAFLKHSYYSARVEYGRMWGPDEQGEFYFKHDILDQLDDYMYYIARMKNADPDAYYLYSRIGGRIGNTKSASDRLDLDPWFVQTLPSFGCVCFCTGKLKRAEDKAEAHKKPEDRNKTPRFLYFTRYDTPPADIERVPPGMGTTYLLTVYHDFDGKQGIYPIIMPVVVRPDGKVDPLRMRFRNRQIIRHKHGDWRGYSSAIPIERWGLPHYGDETKVRDKAGAIRFLFVWGANHWFDSNRSMIDIKASKNGLTAAFGVDVTRTPYFFRDRDTVTNGKGKTARIFHIVRAHQRTVTGRRVSVRTHFAGLRNFTWNGYEIRITVPGRDHAWLAEFDTPFHAEELLKPEQRVRMGDMRELGNILANHMRAGWRSLQRAEHFTMR